MRRLAASAVLLVALGACDSGSDAVGLTGRWEGTVAAPGGTYDVELRLSDTGRAVSGTGTVQVPNGPFRFAIADGSFIGTAVSLPFRLAEAPFNGSLSGTLVQQDPGRVEGRLVGPEDVTGDVEIELVGR